jgi:hypothetical protein
MNPNFQKTSLDNAVTKGYITAAEETQIEDMPKAQ